MEHLEKLLEMTDAEFGAIAKNGKFKSREEIDSVYKLMDIAKDIYCVWQYEEEMEEDEDDQYRRGSYLRKDRVGVRGERDGMGYSRRYDESYDDGMGRSYRRGRGRNAKRDSMGRYSRESGKEEYIEQMRDLMEDAPDEQTRISIQRMIEKMEQQ